MSHPNRQIPPFGQFGNGMGPAGVPLLGGDKISNMVSIAGHLVHMGTITIPVDPSGKNFRTVISEGISKWEYASMMIQASNPDKPVQWCVARARELLEEIMSQATAQMKLEQQG